MDLKISDMIQMQRELFKLHQQEWPALEPEYGKNMILYMVEEIGEVISIVKKKGDRAITDDTLIRNAFLEEMADVMMYYMDILLRYHVTAEEISNAFARKHAVNMGRNYTLEYKEKYHG